MPPPFPFAGELSAVACSLCWAVAGVVLMRIVPKPSAGAMNLGKNLTAIGCFGLLLVVVGGRPWPAAVGWTPFLLLAASGVVGLAVCDSLILRAFLEVGPRRTNVYMAMWPGWVAVLALSFSLEAAPSALVWIGMAVTITGVVLAALESSSDPADRSRLRRGALFALAAAFLQAVGFLIAREAMRTSEASVAESATVRMVFGSAALIVMGLFAGRLETWKLELSRPSALGRIALAGFIATFLGIWTQQAAVAWSTHAGVGATLNSLAPIFLIPLSAAFLGERHDWRAWASALLAVAGIALMTA